VKKLNVLGLKVSVKMKNPESFDAEAEWYPMRNEIFVKPDAEEKFNLVLHELFHAIWTRSGVYQTKIDVQVEEILSEAFANVVSENMVTLWQMYNKLKKK
jgi:hypothetical protein